jgi:hypothetical protein
MDEKYLWPLVGVVLGSFLTFVTSGIKDRAENRRKVGLLLSKLFATYSQLKTVRAVLEHFEDYAEGPESYERYRKDIVGRHFLEPPSHLESLNDAVGEISGIYPLLALELQSLIEMLVKNKAASLSESSKSDKLYAQFLAVYEVSLDFCEKGLTKHIHWLAWQHGPFTYFKVLRRIRNRMSNESGAFMKKFSDEAFTEIKQTRTSIAATADSSS